MEDLTDFQKWAQNNQEQISGFSVTMPHKKNICRYAESNYPVGNFYLPAENRVLNSDLVAFHKAIIHLKLDIHFKVLIIGSGATAEAALISFKNFPDLNITSRNQKECNKFSEIYNCNVLNPADLSSISFDLIINCTPLGMAGENPLAVFNIKPPRKVIDLPYTDSDTPLIEFCKENKIESVNGHTFWHWQSQLHIEEFLKCLPI